MGQRQSAPFLMKRASQSPRSDIGALVRRVQTEQERGPPRLQREVRFSLRWSLFVSKTQVSDGERAGLSQDPLTRGGTMVSARRRSRVCESRFPGAWPWVLCWRWMLLTFENKSEHT